MALFESTWRDVVVGTRILRRSPRFTFAAASVLALAIGLNTAIFSLVNATLLRALPVRDPAELAFVYAPRAADGAASYEEAISWRSANTVFSDVATVSSSIALLGAGADAATVNGEGVSSNYFALLGLSAQRGRTLELNDDTPGAPPVVVISDRLWSRMFNRDPAIVGKTLKLGMPGWTDSGWHYTIVGVAGPGFSGVISPWTASDFWVSDIQRRTEGRVGLESLLPSDFRVRLAIGRRQPGVSIEQTRAFVTTAHAAYLKAHPSGLNNFFKDVVVLPNRRITLPLDSMAQVSPDRLAVGLLSIAGLVLLISVSNMIGVTAARGMVRRPEVAVRLSLGADRLSLSRHLIIESLVLTGLGGLGGLLLSRVLISAFLATAPVAMGFGDLQVPLDSHVLAFTTGIVLAIGVIVGLAPVRQAFRVDVITALRGAAHGVGQTVRSRLRRWIVLPQVGSVWFCCWLQAQRLAPFLRAQCLTWGTRRNTSWLSGSTNSNSHAAIAQKSERF